MKKYNKIVVRNTKELEMMDLSRLPDNVEVQVLGGLCGKQKYATKSHYQARTTYPLGQLKQIIATMHEIESNINPNWPEMTRAKYIYEVLGNNITYDYDRANYSTQQASNLSILLSRKGICAGYSLLFKEMMDRQGIECDYVRGDAFNSQGGKEKHAWNVLKINGKNIPIDLTWDAPNIQRGEGLKHFGNDYEFTNNHILDYDEVQYNYDYLNQNDLNNSDYRNYKAKRDIKHETYSNALRETYVKYSKLESPESALGRVKKAMHDYITAGYSRGFTRDGFARSNLERNVSPEELLDYLVDDYVNKFTNTKEQPTIRRNPKEQYLAAAITETMATYSPEQSKAAIKAFITENKTSMFTNQGNSQARTTLAYHISNGDVLNFLIDNTVKKELFRQHDIDVMASMRSNEIGKAFQGQEFELVAPPKEKGLFSRVVNWVKDKTRNITRTQNRDNSQHER